jgi:mannose-6-phosphate isomerase-like protein (cupin superfamily)
MPAFGTLPLPAAPTTTAPDGTAVRPLLTLAGGSFAHFTLPAGAVSGAVRHQTVEEIWWIVSGEGEIWRAQHGRGTVEPLQPGVCLSIPLGTAFQFRSRGDTPLTFVAVTMPPWPGMEEDLAARGLWEPTV